MQVNPLTISPEQLLLDPNNYRFLDVDGYKAVTQRARYPEPGVQERALQILQTNGSFELSSLRDSILSNGFVPFEQIVVERFNEASEPALYLVVEGNRRTAAIKTLLRDHRAGAVTIPAEVMATLENVPVVEILGTENERRRYQKTLMAIRHVAGIREWGAYQQAKLVVEMFDNEEHAFGPVAQRVGISSREVARRYRAYKALQQMEEDDEFGEHAEPRLYSFFHEAVSQPKVREWLKWSDETYKAEDANARRVFYELLSPRFVDDERQDPKLQNANRQVRQLKEIVDKPIPLKILSDPEKSLEEAVAAAADETFTDSTGVLEHSLGVALHALREPGIDTWLSPTDKAKEVWNDLVGLVDKVRKMMDAQ
ncbi:MAG: hypothetical protein KAX56_06485 [Phenylobacterium sp.]|nr:hypothetical protein [Phenylobacterium sp.]